MPSVWGVAPLLGLTVRRVSGHSLITIEERWPSNLKENFSKIANARQRRVTQGRTTSSRGQDERPSQRRATALAIGRER